MERVRRWESRSRRTASRRRSVGSGRRDGRNVSLAPREKRRLLQLCVCAVLFLLVFLGRGAIPGGMGEVRGELLHIIQTDTDFKTVFAELGRAVAQVESGREVVTQVWKSVLELVGVWSP